MDKAIFMHRGDGNGEILAATGTCKDDWENVGNDVTDIGIDTELSTQPHGLIVFEGEVEDDDESDIRWEGKLRKATAADLIELKLIDG